MLAEDLILVTGATGSTGSILLQQLEARGARLRAMVRGQPDGALRDTSATIVVGNFDDPRSLEAEAATISPHVLEVTGVKPHDIRTFARDYARAFVGE